SFVIPNYNGCRLLKDNLPKIIKSAEASGRNYEVIVVDDASSDESVEYLRKNYPRVKLIANRINKRFALSCNDGVNSAQGEIVVLFNTDVVPEKDFLKPLIANFKDEKVFAVGCKEKSIVEGKITFSGRALGIFKRGFLVHRRAKDQNKKETLWVASGSAAYRKDIWQKLGGLDPIYSPAYMEDLDLSYRALKSGYKLVFEPKALVFHQHETTNKKVFGARAVKIAAYKNQLIFIWKNITDFKFLFFHLLWLPYHLIFDSIKSKGLFFVAFIKALGQLIQTIRSRAKAVKTFKLSDRQVLPG
ncbi:glycosyltransferase family 2 protein, partial [Candidatus Gribaldobacteria bacterium]|nr:glycosyltransferase family 2 protein [Candidatus Gribaldobacteria bacterium]